MFEEFLDHMDIKLKLVFMIKSKKKTKGKYFFTCRGNTFSTECMLEKKQHQIN